jgi:hypothetical protein
VFASWFVGRAGTAGFPRRKMVWTVAFGIQCERFTA